MIPLPQGPGLRVAGFIVDRKPGWQGAGADGHRVGQGDNEWSVHGSPGAILLVGLFFSALILPLRPRWTCNSSLNPVGVLQVLSLA